MFSRVWPQGPLNLEMASDIILLRRNIFRTNMCFDILSWKSVALLSLRLKVKIGLLWFNESDTLHME